jgi:chromosome segregation ATPase
MTGDLFHTESETEFSPDPLPENTPAKVTEDTALDVLLDEVDQESRERILRIAHDNHLHPNDTTLLLLSIVKAKDDAAAKDLREAAGEMVKIMDEIKDASDAINRYRKQIGKLRVDLESATAESAAYYESITNLKSKAHQLIQKEIKNVAIKASLKGAAIVFVLDLIFRIFAR